MLITWTLRFSVARAVNQDDASMQSQGPAMKEVQRLHVCTCIVTANLEADGFHADTLILQNVSAKGCNAHEYRAG